MNTPNFTALEALENEAEKRRQDAAKKAETPLPKCIRSVESTEVLYVIDPDILPYNLVDPLKLNELLRSKYYLSVAISQGSDISALRQFGIDASMITEEGLMRLAFKNIQHVKIPFTEGRYPTGPNTFVRINTLVFGREQIQANVSGVTEIAEAIIADAFEVLWHASGAIKKWNDKDVQSMLQLKSYGTSTKVDFGCDPKELLNISFSSFLDANIDSGKRYGASMVGFSGYDSFKPSNTTKSVWTFETLELLVHTFNTLTGRHETSRVKFDISTKDDRGRGSILMTSELPFDVHAELAADIVIAIKHKN